MVSGRSATGTGATPAMNEPALMDEPSLIDNKNRSKGSRMTRQAHLMNGEMSRGPMGGCVRVVYGSIAKSS